MVVDYYANQILAIFAVAAILALLLFHKVLKKEIREMLQVYLGGIALVTTLGVLIYIFLLVTEWLVF